MKLGLITEVLVCASLSFLDTLNHYELFGRPAILNMSPILIAIFPLVVPTNPRVTLWISLLAALTAPLSVFVIDALIVEVRAPLADAIAVGTIPLLSVVVAFAASRSLHEAYVDVEELRQEQALLETLLEQVGTAVLLTNAEQRLVYANGTARALLLNPGTAQGMRLEEALHERVKAIGPAWLEERDATLTLIVGGEPEVLQIVRREIEVGFRPHELLVARRVTEALRASEIAAYSGCWETRSMRRACNRRSRWCASAAWRHAMTPLFSTKPKGSGLGLALCREILEAHGGRLGLFPREGGGTTVRCWLPRGLP